MPDKHKRRLKRLRESLSECTLLLKKDGRFPLEGSCRIALYGNGARGTLKGGTGSGDVNSLFFTTAEQGLINAGFQITTEQWLEAYEEKKAETRKAFIRDIKTRARKQKMMAPLVGMGAVMPEPEYELELHCDSDAALYVLSRTSGEGNDRRAEKGDFLLTETEKRDILALNSHCDRFMLVLNVCGPVDLGPVNDVKNILLLSQLGAETGDVLADIILGKANPSGKLTTTWSAWEDYCPDLHFGDKDDTFYREGIYVGYRYFDSAGRKADYPFGYGLSYTEFSVKPGKIELEGTKAKVTAGVRNTGKMAGKETVQVYVSAPDGELDKPFQELAGFAKTKALAPGEAEQITICFDFKDLASYSEKMSSYILEAGDYFIRVGTSSTDNVIAAAVKLDREICVRKVRSVLPAADFEDKVYNEKNREAVPENIPHLTMNPAAFTPETVSYERQEEILPEAEKLTDEELVKMNIGAFSEKWGKAGVIGDTGQQVCGSAGETCSINGVKAIVMADGPAGLRLARDFYRDDKGLHAVGTGAIPEGVMDFLPGVLRIGARVIRGEKKKIPKNAVIEHQYTTAIPIATAIAQSWNLEFAEMCGDIVGEEMEQFKVKLWLAPALNIHRCVLCGRNFEYYSEDPLISGKFAAALTRGVQGHPGCGAVIKHYAANNQELNRMNSNSHVSERAMREIYLKGFSICIREEMPLALMTSYNLVNGQHTSESRGLIEDYLRCEQGFEGLVMSDWIARLAAARGAKYPNAAPAMIAKAGGDLVMPGCREDYDEILEALREGDLSRRQLLINISRIIKLSKELHKS